MRTLRTLAFKRLGLFSGQGAPVAPSALTITSDNYRIATNPTAVELAAWSDTLGANETITCEYDNDGTFASPTEVTGITESPYAPALTDLALYYARFKVVDSETELESDWSATQQVYVADECHVYLPYGRGHYQDLSKTILATLPVDPVVVWANEGDLGANADLSQTSGVLADAPFLEYDIDADRVGLYFDGVQKFANTPTFTTITAADWWFIFAFADLTSTGSNNTRLFGWLNGTSGQVAVHCATLSPTGHGMRNSFKATVNGSLQSQNANVFSEAHAHVIAHKGDGTGTAWKAFIDNFNQYDTGAYTPNMSINNLYMGKHAPTATDWMQEKVFAVAMGTDTLTDSQLKTIYNMICRSINAASLEGA